MGGGFGVCEGVCEERRRRGVLLQSEWEMDVTERGCALAWLVRSSVRPLTFLAFGSKSSRPLRPSSSPL